MLILIRVRIGVIMMQILMRILHVEKSDFLKLLVAALSLYIVLIFLISVIILSNLNSILKFLEKV